MVRIHVVRASHLLIGFALVVLVVALAVILINALGNSDAETSGNLEDQNAGYVFINPTAETEAAFASASAVFAPPDNDLGIRAEVLSADGYARARTDALKVLIYHTHTHEAYKKGAQDEYREVSAQRTTDNEHNIVKVGEVLAELLTERGFIVIHDTTDHELNDLANAYDRSLITLNAYDEGAFDIYIDVHRDAYTKNGSGKPFCVEIDGNETARLMLLVGNGEGFAVKPHYARNFELATLITGALNARNPGLCRPVMVKDGRYNQHISERSLLVEVGHNENTLKQALNAMPYFADALKQVFLDGARELIPVSAP